VIIIERVERPMESKETTNTLDVCTFEVIVSTTHWIDEPIVVSGTTSRWIDEPIHPLSERLVGCQAVWNGRSVLHN
jgi:hypothetical protein